MSSEDEPVLVGEGDQIDTARLASYLRDVVGTGDHEVEVLKFTGGHSNLTYLVRCGDDEFILKQAPPGKAAKSAHDMRREYTVLCRLQGTYPLAPRAIAYCDDRDVIGGTFCLMERVTGQVVRERIPESAGLSREGIRSLFFRLIEALAELHAIDVKAAGLEDIGRAEGYAERQISGWCKRLEAAKTDDMPGFADIMAWLKSNTPADDGAAAVVHNDFKMDNLVWNDDLTELVGVLDWEMATLGHPLMDLGCTLSFWVEERDPQALKSIRTLPSASPDAPGRQEAIARYAERSGRDVSAIEFYLCYGFFRRAVIEQQKYVRFKRGESADPRFADLGESVRVLRGLCEDVMNGRLL